MLPLYPFTFGVASKQILQTLDQNIEPQQKQLIPAENELTTAKPRRFGHSYPYRQMGCTIAARHDVITNAGARNQKQLNLLTNLKAIEAP